MKDSIELIRSLGFGGLLGAGILGLIYSIFPQFIVASITFEQILTIGALIGAGFHGFIERTIGSSLLGPLGSQIRFYSKIAQIALMRKMNLVTQKKAKELTEGVLTYHVLPELKPNDSRQLPPPDSNKNK